MCGFVIICRDIFHRSQEQHEVKACRAPNHHRDNGLQQPRGFEEWDLLHVEGLPDIVNRTHFGCGVEQDPEQRHGDACDDIWEEERHAEQGGASDFEMNHPREEKRQRKDDAPRDHG